MISLETRAATRLTTVLGRIQDQGYIDSFSLEPYLKAQDLSSPSYPEFINPLHQGVFIEVAVKDRTFNLDLEMMNMCYKWWSCSRDNQIELSHEYGTPIKSGEESESQSKAIDDVEKILYVLDGVYRKRIVTWKGIVKPRTVFAMHPQRMYGIFFEKYIEETGQRVASQIMWTNNSIGDILDAVEDISLNPEYVSRHLGERNNVQSSRPVGIYIGNERKDFIRPEFDIPEEKKSIFSIFDSWTNWFDYLNRFGFKINYRVVGDDVHVDLPDQFTDVYEAFLSDKIMNTREIERLILGDTIADSIEEKIFDDIEESDWKNRTIDIKIRPYLESLQDSLDIQLPPMINVGFDFARIRSSM